MYQLNPILLEYVYLDKDGKYYILSNKQARKMGSDIALDNKKFGDNLASRFHELSDRERSSLPFSQHIKYNKYRRSMRRDADNYFVLHHPDQAQFIDCLINDDGEGFLTKANTDKQSLDKSDREILRDRMQGARDLRKK